MVSIRLAIVSVVVIVVSVCSCKQEPQVLPPEEKQEIIPLIHHEAYVVTVDNLRMRDQPGRKSKVLRKLPEGTIVQSDGTVSDFTDQITLRGTAYDEPYHKVHLRNREEKRGWVYGGALLKIYHDETAYPFSVNMDGLIAGLVDKDYKGLDDYQASFQAIVAEQSNVPEWNDALLILAEYILSAAENDKAVTREIQALIQDPKLIYEQVVGRQLEYGALSYGPAIRNAGLLLEAQEGMVYPRLDVAHVADVIGGPYSPQGEAYIALQRSILQQQIVSDASIVAPLSMVVDFYILTERYLQEYDERAIFYDSVEAVHQQLQGLLLEGTSNTPAQQRLNNSQYSSMHVSAYKYILDQYPESNIADQVRGRVQ